jgi:hypothetical protein
MCMDLNDTIWPIPGIFVLGNLPLTNQRECEFVALEQKAKKSKTTK